MKQGIILYSIFEQETVNCDNLVYLEANKLQVY